jgi:hypothetical protein
MNALRRTVIFGLMVAGLLSGCGPGWRVVRASQALRGAGEVGVVFDYSQLFVEGRPEADFVRAKTGEDPAYPTTWADLKAKFEGAVLDGLRVEYPPAKPLGPGAPPQVVLVVQPRSLQMGKYMYVTSTATVLDAELLYQVGGQVTDEIMVRRAWSASIVQPSVFQHISPVSQAVGRAAGAYLNSVR